MTVHALVHPKAIQTHWNGYLFRSRLEARWAVFFDFLEIPYQYEKEGYELDRARYLPDFWLEDQKCWIEVKGQFPTPEEQRKARSLVMESGLPVFFAWGPIAAEGTDEWPNYHLGFSKDRDEVEQDDCYLWCVCRLCGGKGLRFNGKAHQLCGCGRGHGSNADLGIGYRVARAARFEEPPDPMGWLTFIDPVSGCQYRRKPRLRGQEIGE